MGEASKHATEIAVVGPCAAGKSTLARGLRALGWNARQIAQEHSYAPAMWEKITQPDLMVYLDVSYPVSMRRKPLDWGRKEFAEQVRRLGHAREACDIYVHTDQLRPEEVLERVLDQLPAGHDLARDV